MAAARVMRRNGLPVTLIDEGPQLGGRYYKQFAAAPGIARGAEIDRLAQEGQAQAGTIVRDGVTLRADALAWGLFPERQLALYSGGQVDLLEPEAIVLATGAVERVAAFPGWTLPGVATAGGVQTILSREGILAGRRFLVAGTGPLLLAVALEIAEAGGQVVAVIEGSAATAPLRHIHHFLGQGRRLRQALDYERALHQRGVPIHRGQMVVAAEGEGELQAVTVARIDRDWHVVPGHEMRYDVDTLCLHYGFVASTELARMVECEVAYAPERGGWYVVHDDGMRTTRPGIYVAGQAGGIGGADLAEATGELAGMTVARDLGALDDAGYRDVADTARRDVQRGWEFARVLNTVYAPGVGLSDPITSDTTICRCEEVTAGALDTALAHGARTLNDVKRRTRCGMGLCQAKVCSSILSAYMARAGMSPEEAGLITSRPPIRAIPLEALAVLGHRTVDAAT